MPDARAAHDANTPPSPIFRTGEGGERDDVGPPRLRPGESLSAVGLLVLGGFAALGALLSTSENAPLFLLFAVLHVVAAVGVGLRRGWGRTVGLILTAVTLMSQSLVLLLSVVAVLGTGGAAGTIAPESLLIAGGIVAIAGTTFALLFRLPAR